MKVKVARGLWIGSTVVIFIFTAYIVAGNLKSIIRTRRRIAALEHEKAEYQKSITADSTLIERLQYKDYLERFARERFNMQRTDEDVYIIK